MRLVAQVSLALVLALSASPEPVSASNGTYELRWDSCTGPIEHCPTTNDQNSLFASVIGFDQPHLAYQVQVIYGEATTNIVPDAWRFDASGCQTGVPLFRIDHVAPPAVANACPSLQGAAATFQVKDVSLVPPSILLPQTLLRIVLANAYNGNVQTPDPAKRYFLARFQFDHTYSVIGATTPGVDCGGFEVPIRFETYRASYITTGGLDVDFGLQGTRTVRSQGAGACAPVPAEAPTWGAIKAQYRR